MNQPGLEKLLRKNKAGYTIIARLIQAFDEPLSVLDHQGNLLLGPELDEQGPRTQISLGNIPVGSVIGTGPQASALVHLLEGMLAQDAERRALSDELLDSYRELNLLYNLSEHVLASPDPAAIANTTLREIEQLVRFSAAWVLLLDDDTQEMISIAVTGSPHKLKNNIARDDLIAPILARNEAEIYNDIVGSEVLENPISPRIAILCAPLKTEQRLLGLVLLIGDPPLTFTARDLKLLNTVALQAGPAIEIARLYQIALIQGRMERELQMAYEVQANLIPAQPLSFSESGWEFAGRWLPARELSGDYYDFIPHGQDTYGLVIADVADKGLPSALFMVTTRSAVRTAVDQADSPAAAISGANRLVSQDSTDGLFVTMIYGQLDSGTGSFAYVNAGHNPALHYQAHQKNLIELARTGIPLGILATAHYEQREIQLQPGDAVIFYTDGVTEAMNINNDEFGMERLRAVITDHRDAPAETMAAAIETAVDHFTGTAPPFDDFTLMIVRRQAL